MALPDPSPGLVIRYDYLWSDEAAAGRDQGKDRPVCLIAATDPSTKPRFIVVLAITHTAPQGDSVGVEIPPKVSRMLGLDNAASWVIVSEYNVDEWPTPGLSAVPGTAVYSYGFIPPGLFARIKTRFLTLTARRAATRVRR